MVEHGLREIIKRQRSLSATWNRMMWSAIIVYVLRGMDTRRLSIVYDVSCYLLFFCEEIYASAYQFFNFSSLSVFNSASPSYVILFICPSIINHVTPSSFICIAQLFGLNESDEGIIHLFIFLFLFLYSMIECYNMYTLHYFKY